MSAKGWSYFIFRVSYGSSSRKIAVFAPNEEIARLSTGAFDDERVELLKETPGSLIIAQKSQVKTKELVCLLRGLQKCMQSGASVSKALQITVASVKHPLTRGVIGVLLHHSSKNGLLLSEAMERVSTFFDPIIIALVKSGEKSGELPAVLEDLANRLERSEKIKGKTLAGLYYPMAVVVITIIGGIIVNFFVFPSIMRNFKMLNAELPKITQLMADFIEVTSGNPVFLAIPVLGIVGLIAMRKRIFGSKLFQRAVLKIPVIGNLLSGAILVRSLHTLSLLQRAGTNVVDAYKMTIAVAGNCVFQEYFAAVLENIKLGDTPDKAYQKERYRLGSHSTEIANLMRVASFTGDDWKMLQGLAFSLEEDVNVKSEALPKLIEPFLLLFIAIVVGLMIAAIYLPSFYLLLNAFKS